MNYKTFYNPTNSSGGELQNAKYVKMPVKPRGKGLRALLKNPKGLEIFGIWCLLLQAATESTTPSIRGKLLNHKDEPANVDEIASAISLDGKTTKVKNALDILIDMGWLIYEPNTESIQNHSVMITDTPPPKISKDKISKDKDKDKYLDFVFLTKQEHQKLVDKFGEKKVKDKIEELNDGIGSKGYKYKSHYHTILSWSRKNEMFNRQKNTNTRRDLKQTPPSKFGEEIKA